jgi:mono/diheme cytochrome c family protein
LAATLYLGVLRMTVVRAEQPQMPPALANALPADATGEQMFALACSTCHAVDGTGSPEHVVGFRLPLPNGHDLPDFTDCSTNTVEPLADWSAVVHRGGRVRALDRHMPAFGDALSGERIDRILQYVRSFCRDRQPHGELNPHAFFTEKAFPENQAWTTAVTTAGSKAANEVLYEHRIGARGQYEVAVPFDLQQDEDGAPWSRGLGDVEVAVRRTFLADVKRGSIFAAGGAVTLPTGKESQGLGNGFTILEPFAMLSDAWHERAFSSFTQALKFDRSRSRR